MAHQFFEQDIEEYLNDLDTWVRGGRTVAEAARRLTGFGLSDEQCERLRRMYLDRNRKFIEYTDPKVLADDPRTETWYSGPDQKGAWNWPRFKAALIGWSALDFKALDEASTRILATLPQPATSAFSVRGLVVGYVQSGKTASYSALMAKAADIGYKLFIVLSGTTESLRQQTQRRLDKDIVASFQNEWQWLTPANADFAGQVMHPDAVLNTGNPRGRAIAVIKKNGHILRRVTNWLNRAGRDTRERCPVLVIDDEADNASVNTAPDPENPTPINRLIRELLEVFSRTAYVGYTATPFANIFIDPSVAEDLFPRDFIVSLDRPQAYFGAERIFGLSTLAADEDQSDDGYDVVRTVSVKDPDEVAMIVPPTRASNTTFEPTVPSSLRTAIRYFLLATAAKYTRGYRDAHSTMLAHTTLYVAQHDRLQRILDEELAIIRGGLEQLRPELAKLWEDEKWRAGVDGLAPVGFDALWAEIRCVLGRAKVVVDNGTNIERIDFDGATEPMVAVLVGGNTLSRGLTLPGLVVSYFVRRAGAYDTLLQMGRWFGYRKGYEDLPRIWLTDELEEQFQFLAGVEEEIREDIARLQRQQLKPTDLAIRVRTHAKLMVTARNKQGNAKLASASYSNRRAQSFLFRHDDARWLQANIEATMTLGRKLVGSVQPLSDGRLIAREVNHEHVLSFLRAYRFHEDHDDLSADLLCGYISGEVRQGSLLKWNVVWMGLETDSPKLGKIDLGLGDGMTLNCISRSRYRTTHPCNIKAVMSPPDRIVDLERVPGKLNDADMVQLRNEKAPGVGLLLIYPISRHSMPSGNVEMECPTCKRRHSGFAGRAPVRHPLEAVEHVVGAALVFPQSRTGNDASYLANNLDILFAPIDPEKNDTEGDLRPVEELDGEGGQ